MLVRIVATGLCHSDITMSSFLPAEMFPNVFGHEGAGVVEEVGAGVSGIEVGDHVVLSLRSCRTCAQCSAGYYGFCEQGLFINYMGMRMDGSTTYTRDGAGVFGSFFGQSSFSAARDRVRRQLRRGRQEPRPRPARPLRLRLPDRRRHHAQRRQRLRWARASSSSGPARSGLSALAAGRTARGHHGRGRPARQPPRDRRVLRRPDRRPDRPRSTRPSRRRSRS